MNHEQFGESRLMRGLSEDQSVRLLDAGSIRTLPADAELLQEGDPVSDLSVILSGEVEVYLPRSAARLARIRLNNLGASDCFGEYAMIDGQPASASIRTTRETVLYEISHDALRHAMEGDPDVGRVIYRNLLEILVERLRSSNAELDLFTLA